MPFVKVKRKGKRMYRSPSGRLFTQKQVRLYYARGGTFDAAPSVSDPTHTLNVRKAFARELDKRWRTVKLNVIDAVRDTDAFGLAPSAMISVNVMAGGRLKTFQMWLDNVLSGAVVGSDRWVKPYMTLGYAQGVRHASGEETDDERIGLLTEATKSELQGVAEAVSQQSMRAMNDGLLAHKLPRVVAKEIIDIIDSVGVTRSRMVASVSVVKAHATGTLDTLQERGVTRVGVIPERHSHTVVQDAPRRFKRGANRDTINRRERRLDRLGNVNVVTAGDSRVCPTCEGIAEDGPYSIDHARSLIPAHPSCRCAFEAVEDATEDAGFDPQQPRDEHGQWRTGGIVPSPHEIPLSTALKASPDIWDYKPGHDMRGWMFPDGSAKELDAMGDDNHPDQVRRAGGTLDDVMREGTARIVLTGGATWNGNGWDENTPTSLNYGSLKAPTTAQVNKIERLVNGMRLTELYVDREGGTYEAGPSTTSNWVTSKRPLSKEQVHKVILETWPELKRRGHHDSAQLMDGVCHLCIDGEITTTVGYVLTVDYNKHHHPKGAAGGKGGQFAPTSGESGKGGDGEDDNVEEGDPHSKDPYDRLPRSPRVERRDKPDQTASAAEPDKPAEDKPDDNNQAPGEKKVEEQSTNKPDQPDSEDKPEDKPTEKKDPAITPIWEQGIFGTEKKKKEKQQEQQGRGKPNKKKDKNVKPPKEQAEKPQRHTSSTGGGRAGGGHAGGGGGGRSGAGSGSGAKASQAEALRKVIATLEAKENKSTGDLATLAKLKKQLEELT